MLRRWRMKISILFRRSLWEQFSKTAGGPPAFVTDQKNLQRRNDALRSFASLRMTDWYYWIPDKNIRE
jgi:hypothetical protein